MAGAPEADGSAPPQGKEAVAPTDQGQFADALERAGESVRPEKSGSRKGDGKSEAAGVKESRVKRRAEQAQSLPDHDSRPSLKPQPLGIEPAGGKVSHDRNEDRDPAREANQGGAVGVGDPALGSSGETSAHAAAGGPAEDGEVDLPKLVLPIDPAAPAAATDDGKEAAAQSVQGSGKQALPDDAASVPPEGEPAAVETTVVAEAEAPGPSGSTPEEEFPGWAAGNEKSGPAPRRVGGLGVRNATPKSEGEGLMAKTGAPGAKSSEGTVEGPTESVSAAVADGATMSAEETPKIPVAAPAERVSAAMASAGTVVHTSPATPPVSAAGADGGRVGSQPVLPGWLAGAGASPGGAPPQDLRALAAIGRVADALAAAQIHGGRELTMRLSSETLGEMHLAVSVSHQVVHAAVLTEHEAARTLIFAQQDALGSALARHNLHLEGLTVGVGGQSSFKGSAAPWREPRGTRNRTPSAAQAGRDTALGRAALAERPRAPGHVGALSIVV